MWKLKQNWYNLKTSSSSPNGRGRERDPRNGFRDPENINLKNKLTLHHHHEFLLAEASFFKALRIVLLSIMGFSGFLRLRSKIIENSPSPISHVLM